jgi:outer membrane protein OmpA-like peptidoglycan-associated protein
MKGVRRSVFAFAAAWPVIGACAPSAGTEVVFVSCPILRNTSLPCWLGESDGELYYLGPQGDLTAAFYPPEFRHRMLVEAVIADGPQVCGGIALKSVRVSVLPELDINCNSMLPAAGYPDPPHMRGTGPSGVRGGAAPPPPERPKPMEFQAPFTARTFTATFNADSERLWQSAQNSIAEAARYAGAAAASRIEITGYRAAMRLSNGLKFIEQDDIAQRRADAVLQALRTIGVPERARLVVNWQRAAVAARSLDENLNARRVSILVVP